MPHYRLICHAFLLCAATVLFAVPRAYAAGTYIHLSCQYNTQDSDASGGWVKVTTVATAGLTATDSCPATGLQSAIDPPSGTSVPLNAAAGWEYDAPSGTSIDAFHATVRGWLRDYNGNNQGLAAISSGSTMLKYYTASNAEFRAGSPLDLSNVGTDRVRVMVFCDGPFNGTSCVSTTGSLTLSSPQITLADSDPPIVGPVSGPAIEDQTWKGDEVLTYAASDAGGGVARFRLYVDGQRVIDDLVDDNNGRCTVLGTQGDAWEFGSPRPCRTSVQAAESIDTRAIADGEHAISARVVDASQRETVLFATTRLIANHPPVNTPSPAVAAPLPAVAVETPLTRAPARTVTARLMGGAGPKASGTTIKITGVVANAAAGQRVEIVSAQRVIAAGSVEAAGAFTVTLPKATGSATLSVRLADDPTIAAAVALRVRAHVTLKVTGRSVLRLTGTAATPGTATGRRVVFEYRVGHRAWRPFLKAATKARGRFSARMHPAVPLRGAVSFRAVVSSGPQWIGAVSHTVVRHFPG